MEGITIRHRLDLLLRLVDTTDGRPADARPLSFLLDGKPVLQEDYLLKGQGICCFINTGWVTGQLTVLMAGYEEKVISVVPRLTGESAAALIVHLIPDDRGPDRDSFHTLKGEKAGVEWIQGIYCRDGPLRISGFDPETRIMTLFNTNNIPISRGSYGIFHQESETYELFETAKQLTDTTVETVSALTQPFAVNELIAPVVFGQVSQEGKYLLRVRDDRREVPYLIRYGLHGTAYFRKLELSAMETTCL